MRLGARMAVGNDENQLALIVESLKRLEANRKAGDATLGAKLDKLQIEVDTISARQKRHEETSKTVADDAAKRATQALLEARPGWLKILGEYSTPAVLVGIFLVMGFAIKLQVDLSNHTDDLATLLSRTASIDAASETHKHITAATKLSTDAVERLAVSGRELAKELADGTAELRTLKSTRVSNEQTLERMRDLETRLKELATKLQPGSEVLTNLEDRIKVLERR